MWNRGLGLTTVVDPDYPATLRTVHELPPLLFVRGTLHANNRAVSLIGSRRATPRRLALATEIAGALAHQGILLISGLAAGIDTAAHLATLRVGGRPIGGRCSRHTTRDRRISTIYNLWHEILRGPFELRDTTGTWLRSILA